METTVPSGRGVRPPGSRAALAALSSLAAALVGCGPGSGPVPRAPQTPVGVEVVRPAPFQPALSLTGVVEAGAAVELTVPAGGTLRYPERFAGGLVDGATVAAGELLATQSSTEMQLAYEQARLEFELRERELDRHERAHAQGLIAEVEVDNQRVAKELAQRQLDAAREERDRLLIRAPISGLLRVERRIPPATRIESGSSIGSVLAAGSPRVEAIAPVRYAELIDRGAAASITNGGADGKRVPAVVAGISPTAGPAGSLRLHLELVAPSAFRIGEGVEVTVLLPEQPEALTIPERAVLFEGEGQHVFVAERRGDDTVAVKRLVSTGLRRGDRVAVTDGLKPGQEVVVQGAELLVDGARVAVTGELEGAG